jgi:hypothetical protein
MKGLIQHTECCLREPGMEHFAVFFTTTRAARRGLPCITVLLAGIVPFRMFQMAPIKMQRQATIGQCTILQGLSFIVISN